MKKSKLFLFLLTLAIGGLGACTKDEGITPDESPISIRNSGNGGGNGAVFLINNAAAGNRVLAFSRSSNGTLTDAGSYQTDGLGTGSGLGSQGSVVIHQNRLLVCNAGSNEISVFDIQGSALTLTDKINSNGERPISVTANGNVIYVLNGGGTGNISGFTVSEDGQLSALPNSTRSLSTNASGPAQIQFNAAGTLLVVTEKATNSIDVYSVDANGYAGNAQVYPSVGDTPFGFAFRNDLLLVTDAYGGSPGLSAVSSYNLSAGGNLSLITGPVTNGQTAACWLAVTNNGKYCYATNTGSNTISGFRISSLGEVTLLNANGVTAITQATPTDIALSNNSKYVYNLNSAGHSITMFAVGVDGGLTSIGNIGSFPAGTVGLAAK